MRYKRQRCSVYLLISAAGVFVETLRSTAETTGGEEMSKKTKLRRDERIENWDNNDMES